MGALTSTLMAAPAFADVVPAPVGSLVPAPVASAIASLPAVPLPVPTAPLPVPPPPGVVSPGSPGTPSGPAPTVPGPSAPKAPTAPDTTPTTHRAPVTSTQGRATAPAAKTLAARSTARGPAAVPGLGVASLPGLGTGSFAQAPSRATLALPELAGTAPLAASAPSLAAVVTPQLAPHVAVVAPLGTGPASLPLPIVAVAAVALAGAASTQLAQMRARRVHV